MYKDCPGPGVTAVLLCVLGVQLTDVLLRHIAGMDDDPVSESQRIARLQGVAPFPSRFWIEILQSKWVCREEPVRARMPACRMTIVLGVIENNDPNLLAVDGS